jgi:hypothetical protein
MILIQQFLPIIATAAAIFIASSLIHMVFKWHNAEYRALPNEDEVRKVINSANLTPGLYATPHCTDMKEMGSEAMQQKFKEGPVFTITMRKAGAPAMGKHLLDWFLFSLFIAAFGAWVASFSYGTTGNAHLVGHFVGLFSFIAYGCGSVQESIWMGRPWSATLKNLLDAFIYGVISALVFWWLWA